MKMKNNKQKQCWKILLVEDGSIDVDELEQFIEDHDLNVKLVVYRAGSMPPKYLEGNINDK